MQNAGVRILYSFYLAVKLFHVADLHLGCRRLNGRLPDSDLVEAFQFIARRAIEEQAEVFLIAGDLFDRAQVEPSHLRQAQQVLAELKTAGIRAIGIEGNHDKAFLHSDESTWVQFLADDGLLVLLRPEFEEEGARLAPWDQEQKRGAWIDVNGIRFVGAGYLGAATPHKTREIISRLDAGRIHVLLLHAGPDYFVGEGGGFSSGDLQAVREKVCYLALGHIHRPMQYGDWACNPGSPENCDLREASYDFDRKGKVAPRGYAVVKIDPVQPDGSTTFELRSNPRRSVHRLDIDCSPFGNKLKDGAAALVKAAVKLIRADDTDTVIDLRLTGKLNLNRVALDQALVSQQIEQQAGVYAVGIDVTGLNVGAQPDEIFGRSAGISREKIEQQAIRALLDQQDLLGLEEAKGELATFFYEIKEAVRQNRQTVELTERIRSSSLVEQIHAAQCSRTGAEQEWRP